MKLRKKTTAQRDAELQKVMRGKRKPGSKETSVVKRAVKNIKRLQKKQEDEQPVEPVIPEKRVKKRMKDSEFKSTRGIVYIGHIPHGFYEEQMEDYFKQFGEVTRVRVSRSKNTGQSRGYGYIEFTHPEVAQIAAETMNNYLMCGRLLKATYIPPGKQHLGYFWGPNWSKQQYPKLKTRQRAIEIKNSEGDELSHAKFLTRTKRNMSKLQRKLKDKGIDLKVHNAIVSET